MISPMFTSDNRRLFERTLRQYKELEESIRRSQSEMAAHLQILEGLARLDPALREDFQRGTGRVRFSNGMKVLVAKPETELSPSPTFSPAAPVKGMDALRQAFANHPGEALTVGAVWSILAELGLDPGGIRNTRRALDRATEIGAVEKMEDPKDRRANVYKWIPGVVLGIQREPSAETVAEWQRGRGNNAESEGAPG